MSLPNGFIVRSRAEWMALAADAKDPASKGKINTALTALGLTTSTFFHKSPTDRVELILSYQAEAGYGDDGKLVGGAAESPPAENTSAPAAAPATGKKLASGPSPAATAKAPGAAPTKTPGAAPGAPAKAPGTAAASDADTRNSSAAVSAAALADVKKELVNTQAMVLELSKALAAQGEMLRDAHYMIRTLTMSFEASATNVNDPDMLAFHGKLMVEEPAKGNG